MRDIGANVKRTGLVEAFLAFIRRSFFLTMLRYPGVMICLPVCYSSLEGRRGSTIWGLESYIPSPDGYKLGLWSSLPLGPCKHDFSDCSNDVCILQ